MKKIILSLLISSTIMLPMQNADSRTPATQLNVLYRIANALSLLFPNGNTQAFVDDECSENERHYSNKALEASDTRKQ